MDSGSRHMKQRKDEFYTAMYPSNACMWQQGFIDKRFKAGDQSLYSMVYGDNNYYQARRFFFNLIRRHGNMICGFQRRNRKSTITMPHGDNDPLSDDYNAVIKWCEDRDGYQEYQSQSFEGAADTGINLLHMYPDYTLDPISGDLFTDQVAYCNFMIDTFFRKQDLTDCSGIWRRRWVTREAAKGLFPGHVKLIDKMPGFGLKDGRFPLQAELLNLQTSKLYPVDEFHYMDSRLATMIVDPHSEEAIEWEEDGEDNEEEMKQVLRMQPWLQVKKMHVPSVKLSISIGHHHVYDGPNLLGVDMYPFVPTLFYHEPDMQSYVWKIQGYIRNLRDAQYLYNSRMVIMEDILRSQVNSGWIYPVDAVTDPKAFRQSGQGFLIPLKIGHTAAELQRIEAPNIPSSMMDLATMLSNDITKISGVNEELLGSAEDDKSGILSMLRQGAGLTTLQTVFDKLDYSQRLYGKLRLQAIRKNFTKSKVQSILGKEASPRFFNSNSLKYGITVEEGNYSATQRQMELKQLLHFKELGIPISNKSILNAAFITNKKQVLADMQEEQQQQSQMQQAQMAQQQQKDQADIIGKYAKARGDLAREKELMASAHEKSAKIVQIQAQAEHEEASADLELVKTLITLEDMDLANIKNSIELAEIIKLRNQQATQEKMPQEAII